MLPQLSMSNRNQ